MSFSGPMHLLRDLAEKKLKQTTSHLGKVQQEYQMAQMQLKKLEEFKADYQQQLYTQMRHEGVSAVNWINQQSFIDALGKVVFKHNGNVEQIKNSVDEAVNSWRFDKRRLNAFETLENRAIEEHRLIQNKHDQKLMDEYAQRTTAERNVK
jgi:flagellar FliJ protein